MTENMRAARLVFPGHKLGVDDPEEALDLVQLGVGGFCLYGGRVREVAEFTARLRAAARFPLLFCGDYEDGLATQCPGGTAFASNMGLGASGSEALARRKGALTALESRAVGVSWVLAPVLDLATAPANPIVNIRSFSSDPGEVTRLARAYVRGLKSGGALSCLKHFPGHGETRADSHLELPRVAASRGLLERRELSPFRELSAEADSVMTGHLLVPALEPDRRLPYSLSADVGRTLRSLWGFNGLVLTDALNMRAVADRFEELDAARRALLGGSDILLVPRDPRRLIRGLSSAVEKAPELEAAVGVSFARFQKALRGAGGPRPAFELVGCRKHRLEAERMAEACLAWARGPSLPRGRRLLYWEAEADSPREWLGAAFVQALRERGFEVVPFKGPESSKGATLVLGSFLSPRAYSGRIAYPPRQARSIRTALSRDKRAVVVSFGSPFVFEALRTGGLCAFSRSEPAQKAAARALAGEIKVKGRMPVTLDL